MTLEARAGHWNFRMAVQSQRLLFDAAAGDFFGDGFSALSLAS
jgi:hypothetical protein